jgi:membrane-associated phospholipid phosphatase/tRNA A-37 threonylcarbamoyl transferase component Bud32
MDRSALDAVELGDRVAQALGEVGERREFRFAGIRVAGRRRRPSGTPPPLPRPLQASGRVWLAVGVSALLLWGTVLLWPDTADWWQRRDHQVLSWLTRRRTDAATTVMEKVAALGSLWTVRALRWGTILILVGFRRWRHLVGAVAAILVFEVFISTVAVEIGRPRPFVEIIGRWEGPSHPSHPVAALALTLIIMGYSLLPKGRWRDRWFAASAGPIVALSISRLYLGVDHLTDVVVGAALGVAMGVIVFRLFAPDAVFPVSYGRGRAAHLDVGGARGEAIRRAVRDQLGYEVQEIKPVGLAGSAGSTPMRLTLASGSQDEYLFAKLYAQGHLRADRWYKVARAILYGALEDEVRFNSVSKLTEYEDYMLRVIRDAGVPSAQPFGIVELTPEREYLVVTEFFGDAHEMGEAEITDGVIDDGLRVIRLLWDARLAHRDIKPANVMVRDGKVLLIDVAFGTTRPTPWRQAVDLANMMLTLALDTDPRRVYERALLQFAPEDIAEAFAATKSVTIPGALRVALRDRARRGGVDLLAEFCRLAPPREPISIQRWSPHRIWQTVAAITTGAVFVVLMENLRGAGLL